jgi:hypothetical protein
MSKCPKARSQASLELERRRHPVARPRARREAVRLSDPRKSRKQLPEKLANLRRRLQASSRLRQRQQHPRLKIPKLKVCSMKV